MQSDRIQQLNHCDCWVNLPSSSQNSLIRDFSVMWPSVLSPLYTEKVLEEDNLLHYNVPDLCIKTAFVTNASFPFQGRGEGM